MQSDIKYQTSENPYLRVLTRWHVADLALNSNVKRNYDLHNLGKKLLYYGNIRSRRNG